MCLSVYLANSWHIQVWYVCIYVYGICLVHLLWYLYDVSVECIWYMCVCVCMSMCVHSITHASGCGERGKGKLTDRTTSLIRMTGVFLAVLDGRIQRLYNSSRNCEQE